MAAINSMAVLDWIRKSQDDKTIDFLRELERVLAQVLIEAGVSEKIGVGRYESIEEWVTQRNG